MNKEQFINQFIIQFLANYCGDIYKTTRNYSDTRIVNNLPIANAKFFAEKAWNQIKDHQIKNNG